MAAYDIHRHFKSLRVEPSRRKGRPDPFATGFEDDELEARRASSNKRKLSPSTAKPALPFSTTTTTTTTSPSPPALPQLNTNVTTSVTTSADEKRRASSPYVRQVEESDDDDFSSYRPKRNIDRRASPAPLKLAERPSRDPRALAVGNLAYLDDSEEEKKPQRRDRRPSPAPGIRSPGSESTPLSARPQSATREHSGASIPRHTVASAFAGTKYLQDSESDSDEEAISSQRSGSQDSTNESAQNGLLSPTIVPRVDKPKSGGSGVSWRAFSASRTEQRNNELQSLRQSLLKRGKSISFVSHVVTDDGQRIPLGQCCSSKGLRGRGRERSPPRSEKDIEPSKDEIVEQHTFTVNPFSGELIRQRANSDPNGAAVEPEAFDTLRRPSSATGQLPDIRITEPVANLASLLDRSSEALSNLSVGPQTIPEGKRVNHTVTEGELSPTQSLSRISSSGRFRSATRFGSLSRRHSRRSGTSLSESPAHAFLSSWHRDTAELDLGDAQPDDEGQAIGLQGEYIIGRTIGRGGFGVVKEVSTRNEASRRIDSFAVKIVRKQTLADEYDNDSMQQSLEHEISVWRHLEHVHILKLRVVFDTDYATFCIMDLNRGPTLYDIVRKQRQQGTGAALDGPLAKHYAYQLASALRYLHEDVKVCHRDVKLENCLIDDTADDFKANGGNLRLCDFGLADFLHSRSIDEERTELFQKSVRSAAPAVSSIIGTLEYASPKGLSAHRKLFETAGDVWAYGVIVYALCTSELPFKHSMPSKTVDAILRADWDSSALRQASTSGEGDEVYELVAGCLKKNIEDRWAITDCIESFWFDTVREREEADEDRASQHQAWRHF